MSASAAKNIPSRVRAATARAACVCAPETMSAVASRPTVAGGRTQVHPCREDFETADGDASTPAPAWHGELLGETRHRYEAGLEPPMPLEELERRLCAMFNKRFGYNLTKLPH